MRKLRAEASVAIMIVSAVIACIVYTADNHEKD